MGYLFVNTSGIDNRVDNVRRQMNGPISDGDDIIKKISRLYHPVFNGTNYYSSLRRNTNNAIAQCKRAKNLMSVIDRAGELYKECEDRLKKDFDDFDATSVALENQIREDLGFDSINTVDGQIAENITKVVVGVAVITVGAVITVATGGTASAFLIPALVGTGVGTAAGGIEAALTGESVWDGMADGFLSGAISGTISGGLGVAKPTIDAMKYGKLINAGLNVGGEVVSSLADSGVDYISGDAVTLEEVRKDAGVSAMLSIVDEVADLGADKFVDSLKKVPDKASKAFSKFADNDVVKKIVNHDKGSEYFKIGVKVGTSTGVKSVFSEDYRSSITNPFKDFGKGFGEQATKDVYNYFRLLRKR